MLFFVLGMTILIAGYFLYGRFIEKILGPDDRPTPAKTHCDGVDFVELPPWKNMLIQLLNIAGVGPVIGVILGIKFGAVAFLIIPVGNIIGGAVHDFVAGMMSLRCGGANLPGLIRLTLGRHFYHFFSVFMVFLLLLVVAVFVNIPANLIDGFFPAGKYFWLIVGLVFLYYIAATLFPVDKIIGTLYPLFGGLLLLGSLAIFAAVLWRVGGNPSLLNESAAFQAGKLTAENNNPIIPMLFVTIACGILSGFHATQSPIIARTLQSEHHARPAFYGMMVLEGVIAMIWSAAAMVIYNLRPELMSKAAGGVLRDITVTFLGSWIGGLTVISVIILAITSGDTAMRSLRLSLAEICRIGQKPFLNRILVCLPIIAVVAALLLWSNRDAGSFTRLWNYFAWGNQLLGAATLMAATVWLLARRKPGFITLVPGMFMTYIVLCYILWISPERGGPVGFGLPLRCSYIIAGMLTAVVAGVVVCLGRRRQLPEEPPPPSEEKAKNCRTEP